MSAASFTIRDQAEIALCRGHGARITVAVKDCAFDLYRNGFGRQDFPSIASAPLADRDLAIRSLNKNAKALSSVGFDLADDVMLRP